MLTKHSKSMMCKISLHTVMLLTKNKGMKSFISQKKNLHEVVGIQYTDIFL